MSIVKFNKSNVTTVLVEPREDGNIGATARALKNCGFFNLTIVRRRKPGARARRMAVHAEDVLDNARLFVDFKDAIAGATVVAGFTARARRFGPPLEPFDGRAVASLQKSAARGRVVLLFGTEASGLQDEHVAACSKLYNLPASEERPIYNLSQAVLVAAFSLAFGQGLHGTAATTAPEPPAAQGTEELILQIPALLAALRYPRSQRPHDRSARIAARLRLQLERACRSAADVQMWHGLLARMIHGPDR